MGAPSISARTASSTSRSARTPESANAQSLGNRLGKILRINPDGTIPTDNPTTFPGIAGRTAG